MMSHKRRGQDGRKMKQCAGGKRSRWSKQHLYLVLDDWDKGFSIHKIDADSFDDGSSSGSDSDDDHHQQQYHHLPGPPVLRFESPAPAGKDQSYLAAVAADQSYLAASGTKMFIVMKNRCSLVYDADTGVLTVGTQTPPGMVFGFGLGLGVCMPVGEVLYVLSHHLSDTKVPHSIEALSWSPAAAASDGGGDWAWKSLPAPPPTFTGRQIVLSHAVHPDGCTIFMTTSYRNTPGSPEGTYSFNTREATWRWHGYCALPFRGQAHFDAELDAWVGLHTNGCICACQVISPDFVSALPPKKDILYEGIDPNVYLGHKTTKKKLFRNERSTIRASLTYSGAGRFCLAECMPSKVRKGSVFGDDDGCVLHVTIFGLEYNHKGELQTKNQLSMRSFMVSRHRSYFGPFVFWA